MPVEPSRLIGWSTALGHLASEKDAVITLFEKLGGIGYTDSQFKVRSEDGKGEYNAYFNHFNPTLHAADGIVRLAQDADLTIKTLQRVQREFNQILPLYFSYYSNISTPTDGVFFNPDGVLELGRNFDVILEGIKRVGIINTENSDGLRSSSIHALYRCPAELAQLGARVDEVEYYARLVDGEPQIDTTCWNLKTLTPLIFEKLGDPKLMDLFRELQPYATKKGQGSGMSLHIQAPLNWPENHMLYVQNAKRLAAEHGDKVVAFAKAMHDYGVQFGFSDLAKDYEAAVALVEQSKDLGRFVDEIGKYGQPEETSWPNEMGIMAHYESKLGDYATLVNEGLNCQERLVRLAKGLNERYSFRFTSRGLQGVLRAAITIQKAAGTINVDAVAKNLDTTDKKYRVESLSYAVERSQLLVA